MPDSKVKDNAKDVDPMGMITSSFSSEQVQEPTTGTDVTSPDAELQQPGFIHSPTNKKAVLTSAPLRQKQTGQNTSTRGSRSRSVLTGFKSMLTRSNTSLRTKQSLLCNEAQVMLKALEVLKRCEVIAH